MNDNLVEQLVKLNAAGENGFEGLVIRLLEQLTGRRFYLARSGDQQGRDASSDRTQGLIVAVECKRYRPTTELNERELLGELVQAVRTTPSLDVWVLATSRVVPSQLYNSLQELGEQVGVTVVPLSTGVDDVDYLDVLCALYSNTVLEVFHARASRSELQNVRQEFDLIRLRAEYPVRIEQLKRQFASAYVGYSNWSIAQNQWLIRAFSSTENADAAFGQPYHVNDPSVALIERSGVFAELDKWRTTWSVHKKPMLLLGDEGDGKSWAVASWLLRGLENDTINSPVVFLSSTDASGKEPTDVIAGSIARRMRPNKPVFWKKRLDNWLKTEREAPILFLVLDGIDEHNSISWWLEVFQYLKSEIQDDYPKNITEAATIDNPRPAQPTLRDRIALIITCRSEFWKESFAVYEDLDFELMAVLPYDDDELSHALNQNGLGNLDQVQHLLPFIRKPRHFDHLVKLHSKLNQVGEITVTRLVYEDWRDRLRRKRRVLGNLTDAMFLDIIRSLAQKLLEGSGYVTRTDLYANVPRQQDMESGLRELFTGGILIGSGNRYQIDERRMVLGFGLLLADQIEQAIRSNTIGGSPKLEQLVSDWLQNVREFDMAGPLCEAATLYALSNPGFPASGRTELMFAWLNLSNPGPELEKNFPAYFPVDPFSYRDLAERIWTARYDNPWAQELIRKTLDDWLSRGQHQSVLAALFERWLGFVHPSPYPFLGRADEEHSEKTKLAIQERVSFPLQPGPQVFCGYQLTVVEDEDLLRLGRLALALMSTSTIEPFAHAIALGCLTDRIMGFQTYWELNSWLIRSIREPVWSSLEPEFKRLRAMDQEVVRQAANDLLNFVGNEATYALENDFPEDLFPKSRWWAEIEADPCSLMRAWTRASLDECVAREDIPDQWIARKLQDLCFDPSISIPDSAKSRLETVARDVNVDNLWISLGSTSEQILLHETEAALAAYVPNELGAMVRRAMSQFGLREGMPLRQLAVYLREHYLVLSQDEWASARAVWSNLLIRYEELDKTGQQTIMFMTPAMLTELGADEQLDFLLGRPSSAPDFLNYEPSFKSLSNWERIHLLLENPSDTHALRRVLWFISNNASLAPESIIDQVVALVRHEDTIVRGAALKVLFHTPNGNGKHEVVWSQWHWDPRNGVEENHWGSAILAEVGNDLPYEELRNRVDPNLLGYAVEKRGSIPGEVQQYATDIENAWTALFKRVPDVPEDIPSGSVTVRHNMSGSSDSIERYGLSTDGGGGQMRMTSSASTWGGTTGGSLPDWMFLQSLDEMEEHDQERLNRLKEAVTAQENAGNQWFSRSFRPSGLDAVIELNPEMVDRWLTAVGHDDSRSISILKKARSFYEALCAVLLQVLPEKGTSLYWRLIQHDAGIEFSAEYSHIPILEYQLFLRPVGASSNEVWNQRLLGCKSDRDLLALAIVAQRGNGKEWMWELIEASLTSDILFVRARGIALLGFSSDSRAEETLQSLIHTLPDTWLRWQVAERSLRLFDTNRWAKHWFRRFFEVEDDVIAWSSFRLFLKCVDSRFAQWKSDVMREVVKHERTESRKVFLEINNGDIKNSIRDNEKDLREKFLGHKILERQAWPWF